MQSLGKKELHKPNSWIIYLKKRDKESPTVELNIYLGVMAINVTKRASLLINLCFLCLLFFSLLGWAVRTKMPWVMHFDRLINNFIYSGISNTLTPLAKLLTHLADYRFLFLLAIFFCILFFFLKKGIAGLIFLVFYSGTRELRTFTKDLIGRTRPSEGNGYSFPSGHMMYATFFYGFLFYMFLRSMSQETRKKWKGPLLGVYFILLAGIGWSRIYLNDHFATDNLGGAALGFACLLFSILLLELIEKRKKR
ncbi:phosphatase PAP2 family protein [Metabacillus sp. RGM 3146]|uniref:phosphatase PAP2 family protein n=1 Tax=Metabacillus sp. RGM 3146 TaxID=3401092 RepID=UPI003B99614E